MGLRYWRLELLLVGRDASQAVVPSWPRSQEILPCTEFLGFSDPYFPLQQIRVDSKSRFHCPHWAVSACDRDSVSWRHSWPGFLPIGPQWTEMALSPQSGKQRGWYCVPTYSWARYIPSTKSVHPTLSTRWCVGSEKKTRYGSLETQTRSSPSPKGPNLCSKGSPLLPFVEHHGIFRVSQFVDSNFCPA